MGDEVRNRGKKLGLDGKDMATRTKNGTFYSLFLKGEGGIYSSDIFMCWFLVLWSFMFGEWLLRISRDFYIPLFRIY